MASDKPASLSPFKFKSMNRRSIGSAEERSANACSTDPADRVVCPAVCRNDSARTRTWSSSSTKRITATTHPHCASAKIYSARRVRHASGRRSTRRPTEQLPPRKKALVDLVESQDGGHFVLSWANPHTRRVSSSYRFIGAVCAFEGAATLLALRPITRQSSASAGLTTALSD